MAKRFSILQDTKNCLVCGTSKNIHIHEVYYGRNRQKSIEDGCCVYLCGEHHNLSKNGIHYDHEFDIIVKKAMEKRWLEYYNKDIDDFINSYGRNYL